MNELRISSKRRVKMRLALQGPAGSGKTLSSLMIAYGMTGDWSKIVVIDSENGSADLYAHLGGYYVMILDDNSPEALTDAICDCENEGFEVIIIDSLSRSWDYILDCHSAMIGNSYTNWSKVTPRYNALISKILSSESHVICTMRTKQDYVLNEKNGRMVPEKVGLKAVMRDGVEYDFTTVMDIDMKHMATVSKDRTMLFMDRPEFIIGPETGKAIERWCATEYTKVQFNQ